MVGIAERERAEEGLSSQTELLLRPGLWVRDSRPLGARAPVTGAGVEV